MNKKTVDFLGGIMKKSLLVLLAMVLLISPVFAAGNAEGDAGAVTELEFWSFWSPGTSKEAMMVAITEEFEAENPDIKINMSYIGMDITQKLRPLFVSKDAPDIIENNSSEISNFAAEKLLAPLNSYLDEKDYTGETVWKETFLKGGLESSMIEGNNYIIPMTLNITGWFFDKNLFSAQGIEAPKTWQGLLDSMQTLRSNGIEPIGIDGNVDFYGTWPFFNIAVRMAGLEKFQKAIKGEVSWNDPDFIAAANYFKQLVVFYEDGWRGQQYPGANASFVQGKTALMWIGSWIPGEVGEIKPDNFEFDFFAFPDLPNQKETRTLAEFKTNGWALPVDAKNTGDARVKFLKYLTTVDTMKKIEAESLSPSVKGAPQPKALGSLPQITDEIDAIMPFYCFTNEFEYKKFAADILRPAVMEFAFGEIESAEELVTTIDKKFKIMK